MIARPRLGQFTQGTIFCGAVAEQYDDAPVWGIVITARCDAAHDKAPLINYVPIVRLEDWTNRQGGLLLLTRGLSEAQGRFKTLLQQRSLSSSLLDVYKPKDLLPVHFPLTQAIKGKQAQEREQAIILADEITRLGNLFVTQQYDVTMIASEVRRRPKLLQGILKELMSYQLAGYYYIPNLGDSVENSSSHGYVAILREVRHLPSQVARLLVDGISPGGDGLSPHGGICFSCFDFAYPIAEIQSPWVEHFMQIFCGLFGRIGVADLDKTRISAIVQALATPEGNAK